MFSKAILHSKYLFMFECFFHLISHFFTFFMNIRVGERGKEYQMNSDQEQGFGNEETHLSLFFCCVTKSVLFSLSHFVPCLWNSVDNAYLLGCEDETKCSHVDAGLSAATAPSSVLGILPK